MSSDSVMPRARRPLVALACAAVVAAALPLAATLPESSAIAPPRWWRRSPVPPPATPTSARPSTPRPTTRARTSARPRPRPAPRSSRPSSGRRTAPPPSGSRGRARPGGQSEHKEGAPSTGCSTSRRRRRRPRPTRSSPGCSPSDAAGNPAAMATRLGVMYIGWNNKFWRGYDVSRGWTDLKGCSTDPAKKKAAYATYCHRNHIHLSLTWEGASALTSFWTKTPLPPTCSEGWGRRPGAAPVAGGDLVPIAPVRVLSTFSGVGQAERCRIGQPRWSGDRRDLVVPVLGVGGVPETGVAAVAVRVAVSRPSSPAAHDLRPRHGHLAARRGRDRALGPRVLLDRRRAGRRRRHLPAPARPRLGRRHRRRPRLGAARSRRSSRRPRRPPGSRT